MEVDCGLALNAGRVRKLTPMLDAFFSTIATLAFDEADAKAAAAIRAALKTHGQPIGAYDVHSFLEPRGRFRLSLEDRLHRAAGQGFLRRFRSTSR
jgi:hypothetical protein